MKIALVAVGVPKLDAPSGGPQVVATIAQGLAARGHDVTVLSLVFPEFSDSAGERFTEHLAASRKMGVAVVPIVSEAWSVRGWPGGRMRRAWRPADEGLFPTFRDADAVRSALAAIAPDAVFVYNFDALAATCKTPYPRLGAMSDPPHLPLLHKTLARWRAHPVPNGAMLREATTLQAVLRTQPKLLVRLLQGCRATGAFSPKTADWLRRRGVRDCAYFRTPIPDPGGHPWEHPGNARPRILLIGHMRGSATLNGLRTFARVLPLLERELGPDGLEVRVVGGYEPPPDIRRRLDRPCVSLLGFVEDIGSELRSADVLLVPVSIELGVRVRILTAFAHGVPVVAHGANRVGIPELTHGENILLGRSPEALARLVVQMIRDPVGSLQMGRAGRRTYEAWFAPGPAVGRLAEVIEGMCSSV